MKKCWWWLADIWHDAGDVIWSYAAGSAVYINGFVQDCSISSALALEILQSCTKPSIYRWYFVCLVMVWYCSVLSQTFTVTLLVLSVWYHGPNASKVALDLSHDSFDDELGIWLKKSHKSSKKYQFKKNAEHIFRAILYRKLRWWWCVFS